MNILNNRLRNICFSYFLQIVGNGKNQYKLETNTSNLFIWTTWFWIEASCSTAYPELFQEGLKAEHQEVIWDSESGQVIEQSLCKANSIPWFLERLSICKIKRKRLLWPSSCMNASWEIACKNFGTENLTWELELARVPSSRFSFNGNNDE